MDCRVKKAKGAFAILWLFGEIVHSQTSLKNAYLKVMSYEFCCMVQALGKSSNQSPPNFRSLWTDASEVFSTFIGVWDQRFTFYTTEDYQYWPNTISNVNMSVALMVSKKRCLDMTDRRMDERTWLKRFFSSRWSIYTLYRVSPVSIELLHTFSAPGNTPFFSF